jgi:hypothetical protein
VASPTRKPITLVFRVLDAYLLAEDLACLSPSEPAVERLAEVVPQTRQTRLDDGVVIGAERRADTVRSIRPGYGRRQGPA